MHVVFDRYDNLSLKNAENVQKTKYINAPKFEINDAQTKIPKNTKTFLTQSHNKLELVKFLCQNAFNYVKLSNKNQKLFISGGFPNVQKCYKICNKSMFEVPDLQSNHLEADTRILSHAFYSVDRNVDVIIHSVDTDIFILCIHFWEIFKFKGCCGLYFKLSSQKPRTLACHIAADYLTLNISKILPALHAFTG